MTRYEKAGLMLANSIIELCHMMYNHRTARGLIDSCIKRLHEGKEEIQPKKATSKYKKARYENKIPKL